VINFTPRPLYSGERAPGSHWIGDWVSPRTGLDAVTKKKKFLPLPGIEPHPGSHLFCCCEIQAGCVSRKGVCFHPFKRRPDSLYLSPLFHQAIFHACPTVIFISILTTTLCPVSSLFFSLSYFLLVYFFDSQRKKVICKISARRSYVHDSFAFAT
jgi:hypothetical protein